MTSNIGSQWIQDLAGKEEELRLRIKQVLKENLSPEFLNRIDETIVFHNLSKEQIEQIVSIQLKDLQRRLEQHNLKLIVTDEIKKKIAKEGYDPAYGARPLKRTIQHLIENPLSTEILQGKFPEGSEIAVELEDSKIKFSISELTAVN